MSQGKKKVPFNNKNGPASKKGKFDDFDDDDPSAFEAELALLDEMEAESHSTVSAGNTGRNCMIFDVYLN